MSAISDSFVDAFAALDPVEAVCEMGVGLDADTMTDYSPDGEAAMADLYRSTRAAFGRRIKATRTTCARWTAKWAMATMA